MKKKLLVMVTALLVLGTLLAAGQGAALAQPGDGEEEPQGPGPWQRRKAQFEVLSEFQEEILTLNSLRIEWHLLKVEMIENNNQILPLVIAAVNDQNFEALKNAREIRARINELHVEIHELRRQFAGEREAFRKEARAGDYEAAREHAEMMITITSGINELGRQKLEYQAETIEVLSN